MNIKNQNNQKIDAFVVYARPSNVVNESLSQLLTGGWFIQQIGDPAEKISIEVICGLAALQSIRQYASNKSRIFVETLDGTRMGVIIGTPSYQILKPHQTDPTYTVNFELAVISNV